MTQPAPAKTAPGTQPNWFIAVGKERLGPFDADGMRQKIEAGELTPDQRVWKKGFESWQRSRNVPEIQSLHEAVELSRRDIARWHVAVNKKPTGPYSDNQLERQLADGVLTEKSSVWRKGQEKWSSLGSVAELSGVRERAELILRQNLPPAIEDEEVGPPAIDFDDAPPAPVVQAQAAPKAVAVAAPAAAVKAAPVAGVQAAPVRAEPPAAEKPIVVKPASAKPAALDPVRLDPQRVAGVDLACDSVKDLFANDPRLSAGIEQIRAVMRKDFMTGNAIGLDKSVNVMSSMIGKALKDAKPGQTAAAEGAWGNLVGVHRSAMDQVSIANRQNFLPDRMVTLLGVSSRPSWGIAPRA